MLRDEPDFLSDFDTVPFEIPVLGGAVSFGWRPFNALKALDSVKGAERNSALHTGHSLVHDTGLPLLLRNRVQPGGAGSAGGGRLPVVHLLACVEPTQASSTRPPCDHVIRAWPACPDRGTSGKRESDETRAVRCEAAPGVSLPESITLSLGETAMPERTEHTLLYIKYVDDALAEQGAAAVEGVISGMSLRILARTLPDGRTSVAVSLYRRVHRMRASGKAFHYWTHEKLTSMARTKKDLVVLREIDRRQGKSTTRHVFSETVVESWIHELSWTLLRWMHSNPQGRRLEGPEPQGVDNAVDRAIAAIREHIGELPNWDERFPLLQDDRQYHPASTYLPYLDCHNHAQVAKNLFGVRAYRRPLAREAERLDIGTLNWFAMFRGLVPVDWLIDAMRTTETASGSSLMHQPSLTSLQKRGIRSILRRTPQPVLRRILNEPVHQARRTLADAADCTANRLAVTRDLDLLVERIAARGQRRVRGSRDLEHLVRDLPAIERWHDPRGLTAQRAMQEEAYALREMEYYNREIRLLPEGTAQVADWDLWKDEAFRAQALDLIEGLRCELMAVRDRERHEREEARRLERIASQAQRHRWALRTAALLDGREVASGLSFVVARDAETLSRWGAMLNNCIGGYADELELDVFVAVCEADGLVRLNLQITQSHGVEQILGKYNRDAVRELGAAAQQVVDGLGAMEISFHSDALGMDGLRLPQMAH